MWYPPSARPGWALALAEGSGDLVRLIPTALDVGLICNTQGDYRRSSEVLAQATALLQGALIYERLDRALYPAVVARTALANTLAELGAFRRALALCCDRGMRGIEARAWWILGEIAIPHEPPGAAETSYRQALTLADELGMRPLQAHCHYGLGRLYVHNGQRQQARAALSTAVDLYRTMAIDFWLPDAAAALAEVEREHHRTPAVRPTPLGRKNVVCPPTLTILYIIVHRLYLPLAGTRFPLSCTLARQIAGSNATMFQDRQT
jgi:tetratricopeptide (TPR) repeat protein